MQLQKIMLFKKSAGKNFDKISAYLCSQFKQKINHEERVKFADFLQNHNLSRKNVQVLLIFDESNVYLHNKSQK